MKKKKIIKRAIIGTVCVLVLAFATLNGVWATYYFSYQSYKDAVDYDEDADRYLTVGSDGYYYAVFAPDYLSFTGNLSINNNRWDGESEETTCSLIIWPLFGGGYEFGVNIYVYSKAESEDDALAGFSLETYSFLLDESGNPLDTLTDDEVKIFEENKSLILQIYQKAYDMWGIGANQQ